MALRFADYRVTHQVSKNLLLTYVWGVPGGPLL